MSWWESVDASGTEGAISDRIGYVPLQQKSAMRDYRKLSCKPSSHIHTVRKTLLNPEASGGSAGENRQQNGL